MRWTPKQERKTSSQEIGKKENAQEPARAIEILGEKRMDEKREETWEKVFGEESLTTLKEKKIGDEGAKAKEIRGMGVNVQRKRINTT